MSAYPDLPKVGDIVTWEDTVAGHGTFDGKVVMCESGGVLASQNRGIGTCFKFVHYQEIISVRTPNKKP
jgi:hypothetical protein